MIRTLSIFLFGVLCANAEIINNINLDAVEKELKSTGATGHVHGAASAYGHYVLTIRDKNNFFNHLEFSMVPMNNQVKAVFKTLGRHDKVKVFGRFSTRNPSAFKHIYVNKVEVVKRYTSDRRVPRYDHSLNLPAEFKDKDTFIGKIHAITYEKKVLVVEYKDTVLPLFVDNTDLIKHLYRNDIVEIAFNVIRCRGRKPLHLEVNEEVNEPIKVLSSMVEGHATPITLTGELVMFPSKSTDHF